MARWWVFLAGCGEVTADTWGEDYSDASCKFMRDCQELDFYRLYESVDGCVKEQSEYFESVAPILATCGFNATAAEECLDATKGSCEDFANDEEDILVTCGQVWDCDYGGFGTMQ